MSDDRAPEQRASDQRASRLQASGGLSADELALAVEELGALRGATVLDATPLTGVSGDDLLLVLRRDDDGPKHFVHVALGGARARVATTARRFAREQRARGPAADSVRAELAGAALTEVTAAAGERRCTFRFAAPTGQRLLVVELFGARGLWALCDGDGVVRTLSRPVTTAVRTLARGDVYRPPPPTAARAETATRFAQPVLPAIDAWFTDRDVVAEQQSATNELRTAAERALHKVRRQAEALTQQLADAERAAELRRTADLLLAYAHTVPRGATTMTVPDPGGDGTRTFALDPTRPVVAQAQRLYDKARRLDDGRATAARRLADADARVAALADVVARLAALAPGAAPDAAADDALAALRGELQRLGAIAKPRETATARARPAAAPAFRRFVSAEGYPIFVGRNNTENDELTMRFAHGNDLWLHVGGGRPGSHVVVRLPKQKTASLETLLDAATLAVHFSKARGEPRLDVIYTQRKHVKKPKGLPPGAVVPAQTKTITVAHDAARLRRLLDSAGETDD